MTNRLFCITCLSIPSMCFVCRAANPDQLNNSKILVPASKALLIATQKHLGNNKSSFGGPNEPALKIEGH